VRQRPLTLRSKVATTKMQFDKNVEKVLLKHGCLTAAGRNSDLATHVGRLSEQIPTSTIRVKPASGSNRPRERPMT
jgi:hypothetical protein